MELGVGSGTVFFPELERKSEAVIFPYRTDGDVVNWKAAAYPQKAFTSKKGGTLQFWNIERALGAKTLYITEGEWDAVSLIEAPSPWRQEPVRLDEVVADDGEELQASGATDALLLERPQARVKPILIGGPTRRPGGLFFLSGLLSVLVCCDPDGTDRESPPG